jgi:hypothetical protein
MRAIRPPARLVAALAGAVALLALGPASASARTCSMEGPLAQYEASDAAFVGQVLERREDTAVLAVLEGFKGVSTGEVVEIVTGPADPPPSMTTVLAQVGVVTGVFASRLDDGRLATGVCRGTSPDVLRLTSAAAAQGRTCAGPPPRIVRAVPTVRARELALRVVVADGGRPAQTVRVFWGAQSGVEGNPTTVRRVPRSRTLLLRHRYARTGRVVALVVVEPPTPLLCLSYGSGLPSEDVTVRLRPERRPVTRR